MVRAPADSQEAMWAAGLAATVALVDAPNGKTWQALRELGTRRHRDAASGSGAGIKIGISLQLICDYSSSPRSTGITSCRPSAATFCESSAGPTRLALSSSVLRR